MRRVAFFTFLILSTLAIAYLFWEFQTAVGLFLFSLALAAAFRPLIIWLGARKFPYSAAVFLVYLAFSGLLIALIITLTPAIVNEFGKMINDLALAYDQIWKQWPNGSFIQQVLIKQLPPPTQIFQSLTGDQAVSIIQTFAGFTAGSATVAGEFMVVIFLSIYWSLDKVHFERLWFSLLAPQNRKKARETWSEIENGVGSYFRSELIQSLVVGLLLGAGFWLIGIRYPTILAVIGAVAWLIPYVGPLIAIIPVFLIGITANLTIAIVASVFTIVILVLMQTFVEPFFFRRKDYSALLTVLVLIVLAEMFGLIGFLIAPPLAAAIQILMRSLLAREKTAPVPPENITVMEKNLDTIEKRLGKVKTPASKQLAKLASQLKEIAQKAKDMENT